MIKPPNTKLYDIKNILSHRQPGYGHYTGQPVLAITSKI